MQSLITFNLEGLYTCFHISGSQVDTAELSFISDEQEIMFFDICFSSPLYEEKIIKKRNKIITAVK